MGTYDFKKTLLKALKDFIVTAFAVASVAVGGALGEYFSKGENIEAAFAALPAPLVVVLVPLISAAAVALANWAKHRKAPGKVAPLLLLALLPSLASAQDPAPTPTRAPIEVSLHGGAMQYIERDATDRKDFVYRVTLTVPGPNRLILFARADWTRTQDGGDLLDPQSFRSIEALIGGRREVAPNLSLTGFSGVSWDRDKALDPVDPRLWTVAGGLRYNVPGRGYVVAAAGHHGPVGGVAFLGSAVWEMAAGAAWFGDIAIPLDSARFASRPYTIKCGISARIKGWQF